MENLGALARHGLVARADALADGITARRWRYLVERGQLEPMLPGVARLAGAEATVEQRILAAVLSSGPGALASHRSAAQLWGWPIDVDGLVDVVVPRSNQPRPRTGVVIHRSLDEVDTAPSVRQGIPATSPLRTLVDLGAVAPEHVEPFLVVCTTTRLVSITAVRAALDRHSTRGRPGLGALRGVLDDWPLGESSPDSRLELDLARLLRSHRLTGFVHHAVIEGLEVDFAHHGRRLVLETDGFEFHGSREAFEEDRRRDAELQAAGWRVIRLTWRQVSERPGWVAHVVRRSLQGGPTGVPHPRMNEHGPWKVQGPFRTDS